MQCVFTKDPHSVGTCTCTGDFQISAKPFVVCVMMGTSQIKAVYILLPAEVVSGNKSSRQYDLGLGSTGVLHSIVNDLQE